MRKVFSSIELSETVLVRDALQHAGFEATIQNRYSGRSAIPGFRPPAEVWIAHGQDYASARKVVVDTLATLAHESGAKPWECSSCREQNPASFELCWNCGRARNGTPEAST